MGNKPTGKFKHKYKSGDVYDGFFKDGMRNGFGVYTSVNGHRYEGEWLNDKRHGKGTLAFAKSSASLPAESREVFGSQWAGSFSGEWQNNEKHGFGVFLYPNNDKYDGEWENDVKSGFGVYTYANGDRYEGEWKENMMDGQGTWFCHSTGEKIFGTWSADVQNGESIVISPDGKNFKEMWEHGQLLSREEVEASTKLPFGVRKTPLKKPISVSGPPAEGWLYNENVDNATTEISPAHHITGDTNENLNTERKSPSNKVSKKIKKDLNDIDDLIEAGTPKK